MGRRVTSAVCDIECDNRSINSTIGCEPSDTCLSMFLLKYVPLPLPFTGMAMQDYGLGLRVGLKDLPTSGTCA